MDRILYLTDLDGTLLTDKSALSERSAKLLNRSIADGALFSIATARTLSTTVPLMKQVNLNCPLVLMNGVNIFDPVKLQTILTHPISYSTGEKIVELFEKNGKFPLMYFEQNSKMRVEYKKLLTQSQRDYVSLRQQFFHKDFVQVEGYSLFEPNNFIYAVSLDKREELESIVAGIRAMDELDCNFYRDTYSGEHFLEISTAGVSKASGALWLKERLNADKLVVFGDNMNDYSMFQIADECYAVENACDELKEISTAVIGSNNSDAVAKFIAKMTLETQAT